MIVDWDPERPRKKITMLIKETLFNGGIVAYPTDTFYGMGCDLSNIKAIKRLYVIKKLDTRRALSIICRDLKEVSIYAVMSNSSFSLMKQCLPGPYTFVLKAKKIMPRLLMTDKKEVGIRIPEHEVPVGIVRLIDNPIINTSARIAGRDAITDPKEIEKAFKGSVDLVIDGGIIVNEPSTVIRLVDDRTEILREGKGIQKLKDLLQT